MDRKLNKIDIIKLRKITGMKYDYQDNTFKGKKINGFIKKLRFYNTQMLYGNHFKDGDYAIDIPYEGLRAFYEMGLFDE